MADQIIESIRELIVRIRQEKVKAYDVYQDTVTVPIKMHKGMHDELQKAAFDEDNTTVSSWIHSLLFREAVKHWLDRHPDDTLENQDRMLNELRLWIRG